jgi:hypothetical protein
LLLLRRCTSEFRISRTESIFYQHLSANEYFAGTTRSKASFFTRNPYVLNILAATSMQ